MKNASMRALLKRMDGARIAVLGDFCLDAYWEADMTRSALSRETPLYPLPIVSERYAPGAAGNVCANLAALAPARVVALGALGRDWRGEALVSALGALGVDTDGLIKCGGRVTNAYIKPMLHGLSDVVYESARLDFENGAALGESDERALLAALERVAGAVDAICVCDQTRSGCVTERVTRRLEALARDGLIVVADSRERIGAFRGAYVKPNEVEAARWAKCGADRASLSRAALSLYRQNERPALVTLGADGCLLADETGVVHLAARPVRGPVDICGAGDTFLAAYACALASGAGARQGAELGNLAASVTVRKIAQTGVATRGELLAESDEDE